MLTLQKKFKKIQKMLSLACVDEVGGDGDGADPLVHLRHQQPQPRGPAHEHLDIRGNKNKEIENSIFV